MKIKIFLFALFVSMSSVLPSYSIGTRVISADSIWVGKDVTNTKEYGNVIFGPGKISLKAKSVIIKNSTNVSLATKLNVGK